MTILEELVSETREFARRRGWFEFHTPKNLAMAIAGEEFLLVMPNCEVEEAVAAAERVLHAVNPVAIPHVARPTLPHVITLSAGVAVHTPDPDLTIHDIIERADQALYAAKLSGRNRARAGVSSLTSVEVLPQE